MFRELPDFWRALRFLFYIGIIPYVVAGPTWAASPDAHTCLTCHASEGLARAPGGSVHVDAGELARSVHARLECVICHADARAIPHARRLAPVRCATCHANVAQTMRASAHAAAARGEGNAACLGCHGDKNAHAVRAAPRDEVVCARCHPTESSAFSTSVHGMARKNGDGEAATCWSCHGAPHAVRSGTAADSPTSRAHLAATCARCHADRELMVRRRITIPEATALYAQSVHGRSKNPAAATCNDCHESHRIRPASDPSSSIARANIAGTCGRCHTRESADYKIGIHGTALARGVMAAPTCTDCHGEHRIRGPRDADSPVAARTVTQTCAHCHEAQGIRETYGLPAGRLGTYQDSYHGLAARGGSPAVANCASCHGQHAILPSSDPRSPIYAKNLPKTCGRCHPGAGEKFALGAVHVAAATPADPLLYGVRWVYLLLIVGTIGGMSLHNGLDFVSKLRRHLRGQWERAGVEAHAAHERMERWYVRMTGFERVQHVLLAVSFFVLVFTGFALKFPEAWPFAWLVRLEHGYAWRSIVHRTAAVIMVVSAILHVIYLGTRRGRSTLVALLPRPGDLPLALQNIAYMMGLRREPPPFRRFGYIEKAEYWALIWGTLVMTATGLLLWFENQSLHWLSKRLLDLATLVHYYEAWLAFLAIVVWHVYQNVFNPDVYPMNWTWLTGKISDEQLRHEHRGEWEEIQRVEAEAEDEKAEDAEEKAEPTSPPAVEPPPARA